MILIPELETVVILVPRTASGSLRRAIKAKYPQSMQIYRHMEADGVPQGYDRWWRVGIVRNPFERLWSLYKFLQTFDGPYERAYLTRMRGSVEQKSFSDWLLHNDVVFTSPYDSAGLGRFWPQYTVRHPLPENRKSQFIYLRPDLGTSIYRFDELPMLLDYLEIDELPEVNRTAASPLPEITPEAEEYLRRVFSWDFQKSDTSRADMAVAHFRSLTVRV